MAQQQARNRHLQQQQRTTGTNKSLVTHPQPLLVSLHQRQQYPIHLIQRKQNQSTSNTNRITPCVRNNGDRRSGNIIRNYDTKSSGNDTPYSSSPLQPPPKPSANRRMKSYHCQGVMVKSKSISAINVTQQKLKSSWKYLNVLLRSMKTVVVFVIGNIVQGHGIGNRKQSQPSGQTMLLLQSIIGFVKQMSEGIVPCNFGLPYNSSVYMFFRFPNVDGIVPLN